MWLNDEFGLNASFRLSLKRASTLAMVKLTPELLAQAPSTLNPIKERQLDLRGEPTRDFYIVDLAHVPKDTKSLPSKTWESPRHVSSDHSYRAICGLIRLAFQLRTSMMP